MSGEGEEDTGIKAERVESAKFTQPLLDTPQTVTVVRKEIILQQGATSLTDTLRNVPGITFQLGENGNTQSGDTIFMRGFDTQNAIFLDGIRDLGAAVRDVFNIEQVEIFKGPSGADNGRGATAGYINLASKLPGQTSAASGTLAYGTNERRRLTADWNQTIGETAAFRLNVLGQDGGVAGRDFIERRAGASRPPSRWASARTRASTRSRSTSVRTTRRTARCRRSASRTGRTPRSAPPPPMLRASMKRSSTA